MTNYKKSNSPRSYNSRKEIFQMCVTFGSSFTCNFWPLWSLPFTGKYKVQEGTCWICSICFFLYSKKNIGQGLNILRAINLQFIYLDKCHYESVVLNMKKNLTYSLCICSWLLFFFFPTLYLQPSHVNN